MPGLTNLEITAVTKLFKALGDETRVGIVALLSHGELCVCHIESALDLSQPKASRHLGVLKNAGVVEARRDGSWMYYRLAEQMDERCSRQLQVVVADFAESITLRKYVMRLVKTKGPAACR